ncbi:MAG: hypothetical protein ABIK68_10140 [bacterium]
MILFKRFRSWLVRTRVLQRALAEPADLSLFKAKPSAWFILGMSLVGVSYLMAWPLITGLGIAAYFLSWPALFLIGSPIAYGLSHLVFLAGMAIAGKDSFKYIQAFNRWLLHRLACRLTVPEE